MSVAKRGDAIVVYSTSTGRVRRWFVSDAPLLVSHATLGQGEAVLLVAGGGDLNTLQGAVTKASGLTPAKDRYVVIDGKGNICGAILADPTCGDQLPGMTLVQHDTADSTWTFNDGLFIAPPAPLGPPVPHGVA